jgi:hypothetical protein
MYNSADILDAARSIRPYLNELIGTPDAEAIDPQLAELLAQATAGQAVENRILELLAQQDATREWLARFLQDIQQPEHLRGFSPLPGQPSIVSAAKFVCPQGDYTWHRPRVGVEPPPCPTHQISLDPAP